MHPNNASRLKTLAKKACAIAIGTASLVQASSALAASSWNPTLLVNTESFQTIDTGDGTTPIELRFGENLRKIYWDVSASKFKFNGPVDVGGNLTATGSLSVKGTMSGKILRVDTSADIWGPLTTSGAITTESDITINSDRDAGDATLTFGNFTANETLKYNDTNNRFEFSDPLHITGTLETTGNATIGGTITLNSVTYTFPAADGANGTALTTNGAGLLSWSTIPTQALNDQRYVLVQGDTMTGSLIITDVGVDPGSLTTSGSIATDSNITLNRKNAAQDAIITFGNETLNFVNATGKFTFSDDVAITDTLDVDSSATIGAGLEINDDNTGDAVLTFGSDGSDENMTFNDTTEEFDLSNDLNVTGKLEATGNIRGSGTLAIDGNATINADNGDADAVLTFGNDAGAKTLTYSNTNTRFEVNDDFKTTGNLSGTTLNVDGAITLRGTTYNAPTAQGAANTVLKNDGSGNLSWSTTIGNSSGGIVSLVPEYPGAVYYGDGANNVGQLSLAYDATNKENYYHWASTGSYQDYTIAVRVRIPNNFSSWNAIPIKFRYGGSNGLQAWIDMTMLDTAGNSVALTGASTLSSLSWATANITGPESSGTYTPGGFITLQITMYASLNVNADAGYIELDWDTTTP